MTLQEFKANRPFMTLDEASEYLGLAKQTLYGYVHRKKIPYIKMNGKKLYFRVSDLNNLIMNPKIYIKSNEQIDQEANSHLLQEDR